MKNMHAFLRLKYEMESLPNCDSCFKRLFETLCFLVMNVMTSKKDQLSRVHGFLITVGQKLGFAAGAGSTYNPGMCKQEAPSNIHWPLDPTGSCQHGWDDWGHFFYPVDLPGGGTGMNEGRRALTSYSKSDRQTAFSYCWCPRKSEDTES